MLKLKRLLLASTVMLAVGASLPHLAAAQAAGLPASLAAALQAPNANVQTVAITTISAQPAYSTPELQGAINVSGGNTENAANVTKAFADKAASLIKEGAGKNPALAAAFAVAVENVYGDPQNTALVNGPFAAIMAAAKAEADAVLQDAEVQQAIADGAPGTEGILQAAVNGAFGNFGGGPGGGGFGTSPAH